MTEEQRENDPVFSGCKKTRQQLEEALASICSYFRFEDAHVELLTKSRVNELVEFLQVHFRADETLNKGVGLQIDEEVTNFDKNILQNDQHSIILVSNSTDEIIACRTMLVKEKGHKGPRSDLQNIRNDRLKLLFGFLGQTDRVDIYDKFKVDTIVQFDRLATHKDHRGKGIGQKMMQIAIQFSKEFGISPCIVKAEGSSNTSQAILEKQGFEVIDTFRYDEVKINGQQVFRDTGENQTMKIYVKRL